MSLSQCLTSCATSNTGADALFLLIGLGFTALLLFIVRVIVSEEIKKRWNKFLERNSARAEVENLKVNILEAEMRVNEAAGFIHRLHIRNEELLRERVDLRAKLDDCMKKQSVG